MRDVHTVSVTGEAPCSNRTVDPRRANRDGTIWSDIVLPGTGSICFARSSQLSPRGCASQLEEPRSRSPATLNVHTGTPRVAGSLGPRLARNLPQCRLQKLTPCREPKQPRRRIIAEPWPLD